MLFKKGMPRRHMAGVQTYVQSDIKKESVRFSRRLRRLPPAPYAPAASGKRPKKNRNSVNTANANSNYAIVTRSYNKLSSEDCQRLSPSLKPISTTSVSSDPPHKKKRKKPKAPKLVSKVVKTPSELSYRNRKDYVMRILNHGSIRDIIKLYSVGSKTAERIFIYRQVKGMFDDVSALKDLPSWSGKRYNKFLMDNYLKCDRCL